MKSVRVVSYNICHAQGLDGKVNLNRVAEVLACTGGQLIGLQEVDKHLPRSHFVNQAKKLGQGLCMFWVYGPNLDWRVAQYGNAVLSQWPIAKYNQYHLPSKGEQRGLVEIEVHIRHTAVNFFCTHLGLNSEERLEQVKAILEIMSHTTNPSILVGDFNDGRSSREYSLLSAVLRDATSIEGGFKTFPSDIPEEQIDFVFVSPQWQVISASPVISQASDHLPVLVELSL